LPAGLRVNPERMSRFIDVRHRRREENGVAGGCDAWIELKRAGTVNNGPRALLFEMGPALVRSVYVGPGFMKPAYQDSPLPGTDRQVGRERGRGEGFSRTLKDNSPGVPERIVPAVLDDLDAAPLPTAPIGAARRVRA